MIARMCLSDLHLGDDRSVLSHPGTARQVAELLAFLAGDDLHIQAGEEQPKRPEVDTLVLNGDIWEECVPSGMGEGPLDGIFQRSVVDASRTFFGALLDAADVRRVVWVPGNHDLCLWRKWVMVDEDLITGYRGRPLDVSGAAFGRYFEALLGREVSSFVASYPLFLETPWAEGFPFLLFTHGHLLDPLVRGQEEPLLYLALRALGCERPSVPREPGAVRSVAAVARATDEQFTLPLWERYSRRDHAFSSYVLRRLGNSSSCPLQESTAAGQVVAATPSSDPSSPRDGLMAQVPWFLDVVVADPGLPSPAGDLRTHNPGPALTRPSCLVYGHDHLGGSRVVTSSGVPFAAVDAGGWTSEHDGHLPHSHALVWRDPGQIVPDAYLIHTRLVEA